MEAFVAAAQERVVASLSVYRAARKLPRVIRESLRDVSSLRDRRCPGHQHQADDAETALKLAMPVGECFRNSHKHLVVIG